MEDQVKEAAKLSQSCSLLYFAQLVLLLHHACVYRSSMRLSWRITRHNLTLCDWLTGNQWFYTLDKHPHPPREKNTFQLCHARLSLPSKAK